MRIHQLKRMKTSIASFILIPSFFQTFVHQSVSLQGTSFEYCIRYLVNCKKFYEAATEATVVLLFPRDISHLLRSSAQSFKFSISVFSRISVVSCSRELVCLPNSHSLSHTLATFSHTLPPQRSFKE